MSLSVWPLVESKASPTHAIESVPETVDAECLDIIDLSLVEVDGDDDPWLGGCDP